MTTNTARRAGGFTLLEVGLVIGIFGIIALTIATFQVGLLRNQAENARQARTVADAQAILEASLDFYDRADGDWPFYTDAPNEVNIEALWPIDDGGMVALDRVESKVKYFTGEVINPYMSRGSLSDNDAAFQLGTFDEMNTMENYGSATTPMDHGLILKFDVVGAGAAMSIAALLPQGKAEDVMQGNARFPQYRITARLLPPAEHAYLHRDGMTPTEGLVFENEQVEADQMRVLGPPLDAERSGWQSIENVDEIVFDTMTTYTEEELQNRIRGVQRIIHQDDPNPYDRMGTLDNLTEVQLEENTGRFYTREWGLDRDHEAAVALDASMMNDPEAGLEVRTELNSAAPITLGARLEKGTGGSPRFVVTRQDGPGTRAEGVSIDFKNIEVPGQLLLQNRNLRLMLCDLYNDGALMGSGSTQLDGLPCPP